MTAPAERAERRSINGRSAPTASLAPLIDIHCVAEILAVTPRHIQRLVSERRIPYLKVGRFIRFDRAELNCWLDDQRVETRSTAVQRRMSRS